MSEQLYRVQFAIRDPNKNWQPGLDLSKATDRWLTHYTLQARPPLYSLKLTLEEMKEMNAQAYDLDKIPISSSCVLAEYHIYGPRVSLKSGDAALRSFLEMETL